MVFLGDESTGKTSIITRFMYDSFDQHYRVTIGIDFVSRSMTVRDRTVRLQLWDTAGQERFRSLIPSYIREASVAVVVYDIASRASFDSIPRWVEDVHRDRGTDVLLVLVGNKSDLHEEGKRQVSAGEGERFARENGMGVWGECSAKEGTGITAMMKRIVTLLPSETAEKERVEGFGSEHTAPAGSANAGAPIAVKLTPQVSQQASAGGCLC